MERKRELFFAKHLWQLFWTLIPMEIGSVLMLFETGSFYYWCGWSVVLVTDCYYSVTLFCLSKEEKEYRAAGIGILVSALLQHMQEAIQALTYGGRIDSAQPDYYSGFHLRNILFLQSECADFTGQGRYFVR